MVYENQGQLDAEKPFAMLQCEQFCFALMNFTRFGEISVNSGIAEDDLLLFAVLNRTHIRFSIIEEVAYDLVTQDFFSELVNETDDPNAIFEFLRPWEVAQTTQQAERDEEEESDDEDRLNQLERPTQAARITCSKSYCQKAIEFSQNRMRPIDGGLNKVHCRLFHKK
jgi:hypothetical protein